MTSRAFLIRPLLFAAPLSLCSCSSGGGELDNGSFSYVCLSPSDAACGPGDSIEQVAKVMPKALAVGARFRVAFKPQSSAAVDGAAVVEPASAALLERESSDPTILKALRPGFAGLLAKRGSTVVEFLHLNLEAVDHLGIYVGSDAPSARPPSAAPLAMRPGDQVQLRAGTISKTGELLAGSMSYVWSSADDGVAAIILSPTAGEITVRASKVGTTTLHVTTDGASAEVPVVITDAVGGSQTTSGVGGAGGAGGADGAGGTGGAR